MMMPRRRPAQGRASVLAAAEIGRVTNIEVTEDDTRRPCSRKPAVIRAEQQVLEYFQKNERPCNSLPVRFCDKTVDFILEMANVRGGDRRRTLYAALDETAAAAPKKKAAKSCEESLRQESGAKKAAPGGCQEGGPRVRRRKVLTGKRRTEEKE